MVADSKELISFVFSFQELSGWLSRTYQVRFFNRIRESPPSKASVVQGGLHIRQHSEKSARMANRTPLARHSKSCRRSPSPTRPCLGRSSHGDTSLSQLPPKVKKKSRGVMSSCLYRKVEGTISAATLRRSCSPPSQAVLSCLLFSLTQFDSTGGIRWARATPGPWPH
jgi:hypothetical protein